MNTKRSRIICRSAVIPELALAAALLIAPAASAPAQSMFMSDPAAQIIYEFGSPLTPGSPPSVFASGLNSPFGIAFDESGNLYEADYNSGNVYKFKASAGNPKSLFASGLAGPFAVACDSAGNVYVGCDGNNNTNPNITKITPGGSQTIFVSSWGGRRHFG